MMAKGDTTWKYYDCNGAYKLIRDERYIVGRSEKMTGGFSHRQCLKAGHGTFVNHELLLYEPKPYEHLIIKEG